MIRFESPFAFLVLLVIPLLLWQRYRSRGRPSLGFSSIANAVRAGQSLRQIFIGAPFGLRLLALLLLAVALARPQMGKQRVHDVSKGIAIEMVLDRSGSMSSEMQYNGKLLSRLDVAKRVFEQFVLGNGHDLKGRPNDLIGMIAFARYPDTICPLTLGHEALRHFLDTVHVAKRRDVDGTAIGDAIALAAARLKTADDTLRKEAGNTQQPFKIKSKVIILLTDGQNNCGERTIQQAAKLARDWGIKVYTIGIGGGQSVQVMRTILGTFQMPGLADQVNKQALKQIADETGGVFRMAKDAASLKAVYKEIDRLERSKIETVRFMDYRELFAPFALASLGALVLEVALSCTLFRRIP